MRTRLIITIVIITLILITFESWLGYNYSDTSDDIIDALNNNEYNVIFLGNSMLGANVNSSITTSILSNLTGRDVISLDLCYSGQSFPTYYLVIKNFILKSNKKGTPIILFDARENPLLINQPKYRNQIFRFMKEDESRFFEISGEFPTIFDNIGKYINFITFKNFLSKGIRIKFISLISFNYISNIDNILENRFSIGAFKEVQEINQSNLQPITDLFLLNRNNKKPTNVTIETSFFPEIINITHSTFPIVYIDSSLREDSEEKREFRKILENYLLSRDVTYIDLNKREELKNKDLYADWAHFNPINNKERNMSINTSGIPLNSKIIAEELWRKGVIN